jgi:hypothetical protein
MRWSVSWSRYLPKIGTYLVEAKKERKGKERKGKERKEGRKEALWVAKLLGTYQPQEKLLLISLPLNL